MILLCRSQTCLSTINLCKHFENILLDGLCDFLNINYNIISFHTPNQQTLVTHTHV